MPLKLGPARTALLFLAKRESLTVLPTRAAVRCSLVGGILGGSLLSTRLLIGWFLSRLAKRAAVRSLNCKYIVMVLVFEHANIMERKGESITRKNVS